MPSRILVSVSDSPYHCASGSTFTTASQARRPVEADRSSCIDQSSVAQSKCPNPLQLGLPLPLAAKPELSSEPAAFCAAITNFRIMEIDIDDVPWKDEAVSPPTIRDGHLELPTDSGWGVEVDEAATTAHPPRWCATCMVRKTIDRLRPCRSC